MCLEKQLEHFVEHKVRKITMVLENYSLQHTVVFILTHIPAGYSSNIKWENLQQVNMYFYSSVINSVFPYYVLFKLRSFFLGSTQHPAILRMQFQILQQNLLPSSFNQLGIDTHHQKYPPTHDQRISLRHLNDFSWKSLCCHMWVTYTGPQSNRWSEDKVQIKRYYRGRGGGGGDEEHWIEGDEWNDRRQRERTKQWERSGF